MGGVASMLVDGDTGWHLRAGEWILNHHQLPTSDFFSFTKSGQPWFAWEWLWEIFFAWLYTPGRDGRRYPWKSRHSLPYVDEPVVAWSAANRRAT